MSVFPLFNSPLIGVEIAPNKFKLKTILKIDAVEKKEEKQPQKKEQLKLDQPPLFKPKLREAH